MAKCRHLIEKDTCPVCTPSLAHCPCTAPASQFVEWECGRGHMAVAQLCLEHGAIHVAALLSGDIRCGTCRRTDGTEIAVALKRVNGRTVAPRLGRRVIG